MGAIDAADQPYTSQDEVSSVDMVVVFRTASPDHRRVTDARGQAARDAFGGFPVDQSRWYVSSRYLKLARAGVNPPDDPQPLAAGTFRVSALPPGDYWTVAVDQFDVPSEWQDADVMSALASSAERITVTERQRVVRNLSLVRRQRP